MPIPYSQLNTWSHQGAITTSSAAYNSIRNALLATRSPLSGRGVEIFLQGSYANNTNIYGDGDIDVVVFYEDTFYKDMSALTPAERLAHEAAYGPATYHWTDLSEDVLAALDLYFGRSAVSPGKKAIKVNTGSGRKEAHVVPAVQFRRYATFTSRNDLTAHWGIQFFDSAGNAIVNYPKYHIERGEGKNSSHRTDGQYKSTIRVFKNLRNYLVDNNMLREGVAPSYFLECALYNVPDNLFVGSLTNTIPAILDHLIKVPCDNLLCQNGVTRMIGTESTQWTKERYIQFVTTAIKALGSWKK